MINGEVLVRCCNVSKKFCKEFKTSLRYGIQDMIRDLVPACRCDDEIGLRKGEFWSVRKVSFELSRGECLGLIGRNGAGKTTLLKMLNGLIRPDGGEIEIRGRLGGLIALGAGFNPILTGRENLYINASVLGLVRHEIDKLYDKIVSFAELEEFMNTPVRNYSSGMAVRLGFSIAANVGADVVLLDEVFAVGDLKFRAKSYDLIDQIRKKSAVIIVTHNLEQLGQIASRAILLEKGNTIYSGGIVEARERFARLLANDRGGDERSNLVCFDPIKTIHAKMITDKVDFGSDLMFKVDLDAEQPVKAYFHIHIFDEQTGHVGAESAPALNNGARIDLEEGRNSFCVKLNNVCLRGGRFSVGFQLRSDEDRMLAASKHLLCFEVNNDAPVSASYQIRADVIADEA